MHFSICVSTAVCVCVRATWKFIHLLNAVCGVCLCEQGFMFAVRFI